jgi:hypothetical protein
VTAGDLSTLAQARHGSALRYAARVVGVRALNSWGRAHRVVQQESTATGLDPGGLGCTSRDGDLRLRTPVDGLPLDGMQEVWGSNPHSSTQLNHIIRISKCLISNGW